MSRTLRGECCHADKSGGWERHWTLLDVVCMPQAMHEDRVGDVLVVVLLQVVVVVVSLPMEEPL